MADESPSEREERLQRQEERLQHQHERVKEMRTMPKTSSVGSALAGIGSFFGEHKLIVAAVIGFGVVAYIIMRNRQTSVPNSAVAQPGSLGNSGYQDSGTAYALTNLGQELNNLQATLANPPAGPPGPPGPPGPGPGPGTSQGALLNFNPEPKNVSWGQHLTVNGVDYLTGWGGVGPGGHGLARLWGVPNAPANETLAQFNADKNKVLIYNAFATNNVGGTHDPLQSGVMAHTLLYHRAPGVPIATASNTATGSHIPVDPGVPGPHQPLPQPSPGHSDRFIDRRIRFWQRRVERQQDKGFGGRSAERRLDYWQSLDRDRTALGPLPTAAGATAVTFRPTAVPRATGRY